MGWWIGSNAVLAPSIDVGFLWWRGRVDPGPFAGVNTCVFGGSCVVCPCAVSVVTCLLSARVYHGPLVGSGTLAFFGSTWPRKMM